MRNCEECIKLHCDVSVMKDELEKQVVEVAGIKEKALLDLAALAKVTLERNEYRMQVETRVKAQGENEDRLNLLEQRQTAGIKLRCSLGFVLPFLNGKVSIWKMLRAILLFA